ncbi:alpha/beta hydrolase [Salinirubrum litoreum]|uniref:Alpha/beta hydrolase n=1 Tax=Salinirubrum litoreum TaxID=1126234 RepID=A0ABD5R8V8_9EURY|nr:alpha/beta hydrolase [Salinirubrum litoreum]
MDRMDPDAADAVAEIEALGVPEWHTLSVESARRIEAEVFTPESLPPVPFVRDLAIPGRAGEIPIRVYRPRPLDAADADSRSLPVLVFYHGGGWVLGTLDSAGSICRELARRAGCAVVSVDYRLAPEHPFPAGVEDAFTAVSWVARNAETFGGDPDRIAVGGTSAGGALAAATALRARDAGGPVIAHQLLCYPATDHDFDTDSYRENADGPLLTTADMEWFWAQYLRSPLDTANPYAVPMQADDVTGLPSATVATGGFDPLRDDGFAYADRLDHGDADVTRVHAPRLPHGFLSLTDEVPRADEAMSAVAESLADALDTA